MDTAPLPRVGPGPAGDEPPRPRRNVGDEPPRPRRNAGDGDAVPGRAGRLLRTAEATAGLLSGGLLVLGVALLVLQFAARGLVPGTGFEAPTGPGWGRIVAHLAVGAAGEAAVAVRTRLPRAVRCALPPVVIVAVLAVLWFAWWS